MNGIHRHDKEDHGNHRPAQAFDEAEDARVENGNNPQGDHKEVRPIGVKDKEHNRGGRYPYTLEPEGSSGHLNKPSGFLLQGKLTHPAASDTLCIKQLGSRGF